MLQPTPGNRDSVKLIDATRRELLTRLLSTALHRPMRVDVQLAPTDIAIDPAPPAMPSPGHTATASPTRPAATGPRTAPPVPYRRPASSTAPTSSLSAGPTPSQSGTLLQQAMALPLVKEVLSVFDASIVDVRPESPAPEVASPHAAPSHAAADQPPPAAQTPLLPPAPEPDPDEAAGDADEYDADRDA